MGFAVEEALDRLYAAKPEEFTTLRTELVAAAKDAKDTEAAKRIGGSRKPTTAAWVVNALARDGEATSTLTDLGARLREAHEAMDGEAIRALTAEQRKLVERLTRAALTQAGLASPAAALRDDVTATLQAAIADPDVAARLGRLTKAEQWSGFGEFVFTAAVSARAKTKSDVETTKADTKKADTKNADTKKANKAEEKTPERGAPARRPVQDRRQQQARAALTAAERAKSEADAALSELQSDLSTARLRHQDAQRRLHDAEKALAAADDAYTAGKRAAAEAADAVRAAKRALG